MMRIKIPNLPGKKCLPAGKIINYHFVAPKGLFISKKTREATSGRVRRRPVHPLLFL